MYDRVPNLAFYKRCHMTRASHVTSQKMENTVLATVVALSIYALVRSASASVFDWILSRYQRTRAQIHYVIHHYEHRPDIADELARYRRAQEACIPIYPRDDGYDTVDHCNKSA